MTVRLQIWSRVSTANSHRGRHPFGVAVFVELLQPFVAKADKFHVIPSCVQYVRLYRTRQALSGRQAYPSECVSTPVVIWQSDALTRALQSARSTISNSINALRNEMAARPQPPRPHRKTRNPNQINRVRNEIPHPAQQSAATPPAPAAPARNTSAAAASTLLPSSMPPEINNLRNEMPSMPYVL